MSCSKPNNKEQNEKNKRKRAFGDNGFEEWGGYMSAKYSKLDAQVKEECEIKAGIFSGVGIFVNGYTDPSAEELKRIMLSNGGMFHHYYSRRRTTHIIASHLPHTKVKNMDTSNIVKAQWIVDSLKDGKLLDYSNYLLYTNQNSAQPKISFKTNQENNVKKEISITKSETLGNCEPPIVRDVKEEETKLDDTVSESIRTESPLLFTSSGETIQSGSQNSENKQELNQQTILEPITESDDVSSESKEFNVRDVTTVDQSTLGEKTLPLNIPLNSSLSKSACNTSNPNFLSEFYNNSRLHHISTMGAMFKDYVNKLQKLPVDYSGKSSYSNWLLKNGSNVDSVSVSSRVIMHIDMDCFFVAVGLRTRPDLKGKPVAVTHSKGNPAHRKNVSPQSEFDLYVKRANEKMKKTTNTTSSRSIKSDSNTEFDDFDMNEDLPDELSTFLESIDPTNDDENRPDSKKYQGKIRSKTAKLNLDSSSSLAEIASCSYEARKAGLTNGMFLGAALNLCPELKTIPYDFEQYKVVSYQLYDIISSYSRVIEAVSCDEMYVDVTDLLKSVPGSSPLSLAECIRQHITDVTKCDCSAGLGLNKLAARLATKLAKPNGQVYLDTHQMEQHVQTLPVRDLPGVGGSMSYRLSEEGVKTCGDLMAWTEVRLASLFGPRTAATLYNYCRGRDDRDLVTRHVRKSVSAEVNYGIRFSSCEDRDAFISQVCREVSNRLKEAELKGRGISLKLKVRAKEAPKETAKFMGHGVCDNIAKTANIGNFTDDYEVIFKEVMSLVQQVKVHPTDYRGVGVQVSRLNNTQTEDSNVGAITRFLVKGKIQPKTEDQNEMEIQRPEGSTIKSVKPIGRNCGKDSKGEIDKEVLMSLPEDIRSQVISEYRKQGFIVPDLNDSEPHSKSKAPNLKTNTTNFKASDSKGAPSSSKPPNLKFDEPQPGPSGLRNMNIRNSVGNLVIESDSENTQDGFDDNVDKDDLMTSFSQVDDSFLSALPDEIREELKRDFHRQQNVMKILSSPTKSISTKPSSSIQGTVPLFGGLRYDYSPKKTSNSPSKKNKPGPRRGRPPKKPGGKAPTKMVTINDSSSRDSIDSVPTDVIAEEKESEPSLSGCVTLESVKSLLKEWVRSCDSPNIEDSEILSSYLCDLARHQQLEKLDLIVKFLFRLVSTNSEEWRGIYSIVVQKMQTDMKEIYGAPLKVREFS